MAKIKNGILGAVHGKIGAVVGATWKNVAYLRMPPTPPVKSIKASPAQLASREKFKFVQEWLEPFYSYVTIGFRNHAKDKTEINAAFSATYRHAVQGVYPDLSIDYSKVVLSKGNLPKLYDVELQFDGPGLLKLSWGQNHNDDSSFDDQVMMVVYSRELKVSDGFVGGVKRTDLQCSFKLNPKLLGKSLDVYVTAVSLNGRRISDSEYMGRLAPL